MNLVTKQKEAHRLTEGTYGCGGRKMGGRDSLGVQDGHVHSAMFKTDDQQGPTVQHMLNVMLQPGWEGSLGENEYMCMYG